MRRVGPRILAWLWLGVALVALAGVPGGALRPGSGFGPLPPPVEAVATGGGAVALVTDEKGAPIPGAEVVALALVGGHARLGGKATTGADGKVRFPRLPEAEHWFLARKRGRSRAAVNVVVAGPAPREVVLVTGPEHALDVEVKDDRGAPIGLAEIEVRAAGPLPFGARTDVLGRARVAGLSAGPWSVAARAAGFEEVVEPRASEGAPLVVVLRRLGSILVRVEDERGEAVKDARVQITGTALWPPREGRTGERGIVKMAGLLAGSYSLRATWGEKVSPIELAVPLARAEDKEVTLRLAPGRRVVVRVTDGDADGAAGVAGARVVLAEGGLAPFPLEAATDGSGRALLGPIALGPASVTATADGFVDGGAVAVLPAGETRVALVRAGTLAGRIVDARGRPVGGATLEVVGTDPLGMPIDDEPSRARFRRAHFEASLPGPAALVPAGELGVVPGPVPPIPHAGAPAFAGAGAAPPAADPWVSRADGTFRISPVTPGRVRLLVRHPEYVEAESDVVTLDPGGEREVNVILRAGGALEGHVVDASSRPVAGAHVVVAAMRGTLERSARTGTDGSFAFAALPGEISVAVYRDDDALHPSLRRALVVPEGGRKEITLALPAEREAMTVTVRDDRGYPVAMAQVSVASLDPEVPTRQTAFTDARGDARVDGVVGLAARVDVSSPKSAPQTVALDAAPRALEVTLEPGESLAGEVTAGRAGPVGGAAVAVYSDGGVRRTQTDAQGAFSLSDLAPGDVRVRVEAAGYARAEARAALKKGAGTTRLPRFELAVEGTVEGRVVDEHGSPVRGARVAAGSVPVYVPVGPSPPDTAVTDAGGAFRLGGLGEGSVSIEAYAPDLGRARATVEVRAGRATRDVTIALRAEGGAGGAPPAPANVAVTLAETGDPREVLVAAVAPGSEAERAGVLPGDVLLRVDGAPARTIAEARAALGGPKGDDVVLEVRRAGRALTLRVAREAVRK